MRVIAVDDQASTAPFPMASETKALFEDGKTIEAGDLICVLRAMTGILGQGLGNRSTQLRMLACESSQMAGERRRTLNRA
jgi:hypothetical protein